MIGASRESWTDNFATEQYHVSKSRPPIPDRCDLVTALPRRLLAPSKENLILMIQQYGGTINGYDVETVRDSLVFISQDNSNDNTVNARYNKTRYSEHLDLVTDSPCPDRRLWKRNIADFRSCEQGRGGR